MKKLFAVVIAIFAAVAIGHAQPVEPSAYGVDDIHYYTISAFDLHGKGETANTGITAWSLAPGGGFVAAIHLPEGALWVETKAILCHRVGSYVHLEFEAFGPSGSSGQSPTSFPMGTYALTYENTPCEEHTIDNYGFPVDNRNYTYGVKLRTDPPYDGTTSIHAIRMGYRLRVRPRPATASFTDVPDSHPFFQFVEAMKAAGITQGCGVARYCPDAPLTRGQAAVFFSRALGLYWP